MENFDAVGALLDFGTRNNIFSNVAIPIISGLMSTGQDIKDEIEEGQRELEKVIASGTLFGEKERELRELAANRPPPTYAHNRISQEDSQESVDNLKNVNEVLKSSEVDRLQAEQEYQAEILKLREKKGELRELEKLKDDLEKNKNDYGLEGAQLDRQIKRLEREEDRILTQITDIKQEINQKQIEQTSFEAKLSELKRDLSNLTTELAVLLQQKSQIQCSVKSAEAEMDDLAENLSRLNHAIAELDRQIGQLQQQLCSIKDSSHSSGWGPWKKTKTISREGERQAVISRIDSLKTTRANHHSSIMRYQERQDRLKNNIMDYNCQLDKNSTDRQTVTGKISYLENTGIPELQYNLDNTKKEIVELKGKRSEKEQTLQANIIKQESLEATVEEKVRKVDSIMQQIVQTKNNINIQQEVVKRTKSQVDNTTRQALNASQAVTTAAARQVNVENMLSRERTFNLRARGWQNRNNETKEVIETVARESQQNKGLMEARQNTITRDQHERASLLEQITNDVNSINEVVSSVRNIAENVTRQQMQ